VASAAGGCVATGAAPGSTAGGWVVPGRGITGVIVGGPVGSAGPAQAVNRTASRATVMICRTVMIVRSSSIIAYVPG